MAKEPIGETVGDERLNTDDVLMALQNQINDLARDWEAYKASIEEKLKPVLELAGVVGNLVEAQKAYDLELAGVDNDKGNTESVLVMLTKQALALSAIATQISPGVVQSDIAPIKTELNERTKALHEILAGLEPPPDVEARRAAA